MRSCVLGLLWLQVLKDLQRVLDETALGMGSDTQMQRNAALILEAVPVVSYLS